MAQEDDLSGRAFALRDPDAPPTIGAVGVRVRTGGRQVAAELDQYPDAVPGGQLAGGPVGGPRLRGRAEVERAAARHGQQSRGAIQADRAPAGARPYGPGPDRRDPGAALAHGGDVAVVADAFHRAAEGGIDCTAGALRRVQRRRDELDEQAGYGHRPAGGAFARDSAESGRKRLAASSTRASSATRSSVARRRHAGIGDDEAHRAAPGPPRPAGRSRAAAHEPLLPPWLVPPWVVEPMPLESSPEELDEFDVELDVPVDDPVEEEVDVDVPEVVDEACAEWATPAMRPTVTAPAAAAATEPSTAARPCRWRPVASRWLCWSMATTMCRHGSGRCQCTVKDGSSAAGQCCRRPLIHATLRRRHGVRACRVRGSPKRRPSWWRRWSSSRPTTRRNAARYPARDRWSRGHYARAPARRTASRGLRR